MGTKAYKIIITPNAYKEMNKIYKAVFISHMYYSGRNYINNSY